MPYNNMIPQPADQLDESQTEFLANFMALQAYLDVDHYSFGAANAGKHKQFTLPAPAVAPPPRPTEVILESIVSNFTNQVELEYSNPVNVPKLMTARQFPQQRFPSWAYLGGSGLLMKWGQVTTAGFTLVGFPSDNGVSIPDFTNPPYSMILSPISHAAQNDDIWIRLVGTTAALFSCYASARTTVGINPQVTFFYLAIGN